MLRSRARTALTFAGLFLAVFGARAFLVGHCVTRVPFWDQWDAEAAELFKPYVEGRLTLPDFFKPHCEHRIVLTRLLALGLFEANGRLWSPKLEMIANAVIASATAVAAAVFLTGALGRRRLPLAACTAALLWICPNTWENTLWGFQSQFYLLALGSFLALWLLPSSKEGSAGWWAGVAGATAAALSMASGFFAAAIIAVHELATGRTRARPRRITLALCALETAVGAAAFLHQSLPNPLRADGVISFIRSLSYALSWPAVRLQAAWPVVYLPFLIASWRRLFGAADGRRDRPLLLTGWVAAQAIAMAYCRGAGGHMPPSRYLEILTLGIVGNLAVLGAPRRRWPRGLAAAWAVVVTGGLAWQTACTLRYLPERARLSEEQLDRCQAYLRSGRIADLEGGKSEFSVPYPDIKRLARLLDDPTVRSMLDLSNEEPNLGSASILAARLIEASPGLVIYGLGLIGVGLLQTRAWSRRRRLMPAVFGPGREGLRPAPFRSSATHLLLP